MKVQETIIDGPMESIICIVQGEEVSMICNAYGTHLPITKVVVR